MVFFSEIFVFKTIFGNSAKTGADARSRYNTESLLDFRALKKKTLRSFSRISSNYFLQIFVQKLAIAKIGEMHLQFYMFANEYFDEVV